MVDCLALVFVLWWIVGLPAHGVFLRECYPCRTEATAVVDCSAHHTDVIICGFDVLSGKGAIVIHIDES